MPKPFDRYIKFGLLSLFVGHLIAAYTSFGYHHPDEHFQILEWAHYFVGLAPNATHLPWEFAAQIRPWFQPLLHAFFLKCFVTLGIYNPFSAAFFFRLVYAALNIWSLLALWKYFQEKYSLSTKWFFLTSLLWFFPYIHVRTSSENLSGIFLSFALLTLVKNTNFFRAGLLFGFAFLARYQIALGLVGLGGALLLADHGIRKKHWVLLLGFLVPVGIGALLDRWGYGNWVFTPYQYFKVNLVEHVADHYNPYPWYQYFLWIAQLNPFISLPLFYGLLRFSFQNLKRNNFDVFTAFTASFFILHCFITNKEYRFLLPVMNFVPFMSIAYFQTADFHKKHEIWFKKLFWAPAFLIFYIILNLISFSVSTLHGASTQTLWAVHTVNASFRSYPHSVWLSNRDYLDISHQRFYNLNDVQGFQPHELHVYHDSSELLALKQQYPDSNILIDGNLRDSLTKNFMEVMETSGCKVISRAFPKILSEKARIPYQVLYHCEKG